MAAATFSLVGTRPISSFWLVEPMLRTLGMVTAYNAPLKVFEPLQSVDIAQAGDSVCDTTPYRNTPSLLPARYPHSVGARTPSTERYKP
jgi:hypothetical protein